MWGGGGYDLCNALNQDRATSFKAGNFAERRILLGSATELGIGNSTAIVTNKRVRCDGAVRVHDDRV